KFKKPRLAAVLVHALDKQFPGADRNLVDGLAHERKPGADQIGPVGLTKGEERDLLRAAELQGVQGTDNPCRKGAVAGDDHRWRARRSHGALELTGEAGLFQLADKQLGRNGGGRLTNGLVEPLAAV